MCDRFRGVFTTGETTKDRTSQTNKKQLCIKPSEFLVPFLHHITKTKNLLHQQGCYAFELWFVVVDTTLDGITHCRPASTTSSRSASAVS